jgi:hypothetical protein
MKKREGPGEQQWIALLSIQAMGLLCITIQEPAGVIGMIGYWIFFNLIFIIGIWT